MSYKFLIIGGLHGNEPLGIDLVSQIQKLNLSNIKAIYGDLEAIQKNVRFLDQDLNRVFPGKINGDIEEKRAFEVTEICKGFDFILDFHNTHTPNNDCGFVGGNSYQESLYLSSFLGLDKVIVADYNCINKFVPNCLSVEISLSSKKNNVEFWLDKMIKLNQFDINKNLKVPESFKFCYRVSRKQQLDFKFKNWQAFEPISISDIQQLGLDAERQYYPIFIDDKYTSSYNFAGLVARKC